MYKLCLEETKVVLEVVGCRVPMEYRGSAAVSNPSRPFGVVLYAGGWLGYLGQGTWDVGLGTRVPYRIGGGGVPQNLARYLGRHGTAHGQGGGGGVKVLG